MSGPKRPRQHCEMVEKLKRLAIKHVPTESPEWVDFLNLARGIRELRWIGAEAIAAKNIAENEIKELKLGIQRAHEATAKAERKLAAKPLRRPKHTKAALQRQISILETQLLDAVEYAKLELCQRCGRIHFRGGACHECGFNSERENLAECDKLYLEMKRQAEAIAREETS